MKNSLFLPLPFYVRGKALELPARAEREGRAYIAQLVRAFGEPPKGARFAPHTHVEGDAVYWGVEVWFDDTPDAVEYGYKVESDRPREWDAEARDALGIMQRDCVNCEATFSLHKSGNEDFCFLCR